MEQYMEGLNPEERKKFSEEFNIGRKWTWVRLRRVFAMNYKVVSISENINNLITDTREAICRINWSKCSSQNF